IPSTRQLAEHLGVSRNTVLLAYQRLASEGYIDATKGSHTYVSAAHAMSVVPRADLRSPSLAWCAAIRRPPTLFSGEAQRLVHLRLRPLFDFCVAWPCLKCFPRPSRPRLRRQ